jgi:hypothetical protein
MGVARTCSIWLGNKLDNLLESHSLQRGPFPRLEQACMLAQRIQNLDPFSRINSEIDLKIQREVERLNRITRLLTNQPQQGLADLL